MRCTCSRSCSVTITFVLKTTTYLLLLMNQKDSNACILLHGHTRVMVRWLSQGHFSLISLCWDCPDTPMSQYLKVTQNQRPSNHRFSGFRRSFLCFLNCGTSMVLPYLYCPDTQFGLFYCPDTPFGLCKITTKRCLKPKDC